MIFLNQKCKDCGVLGDARLMPKHCHMKSIQKHPGDLTRYHPKGKSSVITQFSGT